MPNISDIDPLKQQAIAQQAAPEVGQIGDIDPIQVMSPEEREGRSLFTPEAAAAQFPMRARSLEEQALYGLKQLPGLAQELAQTGVGAGEELQRIIAGAIPGVPKGPLVTPISPLARTLGGGAAYELGSMALTPLAALRGVRAIPGVLRRALGGAAFGAAVQPEHRGLGALFGFGLSPLAEVATAAAAPVESIKGLAKFLKPRRSQEAVEAIQGALPTGVSLPAGTLMQSSPLKFLENIAEKVPGSGMKRGAQELHLNIKNTLNDLMNRLEGKDHPDLNKAVFDEMHQGYQDAQDKYEHALDEFFNTSRGTPEAQAITSPEGLQIPASRTIHKAYTQAGQKIFGRIKGMKEPPADMKALQSALDDYNPDSMQPALNDLSDFEQEKKLINLRRREQFNKKNYVTSKFLGDLKRSLMMDLEKNAQNISPTLANQLRESDAIYKNEVIPYKKIGKRNTPFYNILETSQSKGIEPNTDKFIQNYLKPGAQADQANILSELINKSANPERTRQLLIHYHFTPAKGAEEIHPGKFMGQYNKLGERQKQLLFGDVKNNLDDINTIKTHYPEVMDPDFMPKTGYQMSKLAIPLLEAAATGGAALHGHLMPALGVLGATTLGARGLSRLLQSDLLPELMKSEQAAMGISPAAQELIRPTILSALLTRRGQRQ
jgi:hypothetical protein